MKDLPFALVGVNSDKTPAIARQAVKDNNLNWRSFQNLPAGSKTKISTVWGLKGWPTLIVLDENMNIRYRGHDGHAATDVARQLAKKLANSQ